MTYAPKIGTPRCGHVVEDFSDSTRLRPGTRVHHSGQRWPEVTFTGSATVIEVWDMPDGTAEYLVQKDHKLSESSSPLYLFSWWASYHTRQAVPFGEKISA